MAGSAETLAGLRDLHAPPLAPTDLLADGFLAVALGVALALLIGVLVRPLTRRIFSPREIALSQLARSRGLAPAERLIVQARLLARFAPEIDPPAELIARLRHELYRPAGGAHAERLEQELSLLLRRLRP
ncbi:MAG: hypothetical protein AB7S41_13570 [Parvibaculaceae bacterium]